MTVSAVPLFYKKDKNMTPKISVIVPVYNPPENYLRECLDSICNQTLKDIEIILIDNAPPETIRRFCKNTPKEINELNSFDLRKTKVTLELAIKD